MMNEEMEQFEQRLSGRPVREVPGEWRAEILGAARAAQAVPAAARPALRASFLSTINSQLSTLLWPHPKAWAGLAAVWVCIGALNLSTQDKASRVVEKSAPPSPEVMVELKKQQRLFAELVGSYETTDADRPRVFSPKPRSERTEFEVT
jgi:hypothetical protein